ncbi:HAD-like domain-containing protein [Halenospora varia]|nr:HAD-like domain-containing protein [Halenospora varia]
MSKQKHIVFDIVGTCVSFAAYHAAIQSSIGTKIAPYNITAQFFGYSWMTAAELEFTFLSLSERYTPYKQILKSVFYRTLFFAGVEKPRELVSEEECEACIKGYENLELREGLRECFEKLRGAGFTIWGLTTADLKRVQGYFSRGGVEMPAENFLSCDSSGIAKPALEAYRPAFEMLGKDGAERWFAAAHMWDVSAAVKVGFRGAYCSVYEQDPCLEIYNTKMDVMADSLVEMADKIIKASK